MKRLTYLSVALVALTCLLLNLQFRKWEKDESVIEHDIHHYYGYLPAYFIFDDIKILKSDYQYNESDFFFWTVVTPDGDKIFKMTMGLSYLYSPFFGVAHLIALNSDYPAHGFSEPYKIMLQMSTIFYLILGLLITAAVLRKLGIEEHIIALTILLLGLGTNILAYTTWMGPMPHVYNFFLFAAIIYLSLEWLEKANTSTYLLLGLTFGLIILIRPSNAILLMFCLMLWWKSLFRTESILKFLLISLPFAILVWLPQMLYWKETTGDFIFYSYLEEGFNFLSPKIAAGLFGFRKGLFVYTPLMLFAFIGFMFMWGNLKKYQLPILVFQIANIYIILSWWCWWYGGGIGHRAFIESYALMAIPLAAFIKYVFDKQNVLRLTMAIITVFFIWLNIFQIFQYDRKSLHWDSMSARLYFKQFGKLEPISEFDKYLDPAIYPNNKEIFSKKENQYELITLQSSDGKFLSSNSDELKTITNSKSNFDSTCVFKLVKMEHGQVVLKSFRDELVSAELDKGGFLTASRKSIGAWELFTLEILDKKTIALKSSNGKYLSLDPSTGRIVADKETIVKNERFTINYR